MITDYNLCLTETWLKPDNYITLNESTPQDYCYKHEPRLKGKGGGVAVIYSNIFRITEKSSFKYNYFEVFVLNATLSSVNDKSHLTFVLATGHQGTIQTLSKNLLTFYQS